jgi:hypothetical protein
MILFAIKRKSTYRVNDKCLILIEPKGGIEPKTFWFRTKGYFLVNNPLKLKPCSAIFSFGEMAARFSLSLSLQEKSISHIFVVYILLPEGCC